MRGKPAARFGTLSEHVMMAGSRNINQKNQKQGKLSPNSAAVDISNSLTIRSSRKRGIKRRKGDDSFQGLPRC